MTRRAEHPEHVLLVFIECPPPPISPECRLVGDLNQPPLCATTSLANSWQVWITTTQTFDERIGSVILRSHPVVMLHHLGRLTKPPLVVCAASLDRAGVTAVLAVRPGLFCAIELSPTHTTRHRKLQPQTGTRPIAPYCGGVFVTGNKARRYCSERCRTGAATMLARTLIDLAMLICFAHMRNSTIVAAEHKFHRFKMQQIGNAVPRRLARALCSALLAPPARRQRATTKGTEPHAAN